MTDTRTGTCEWCGREGQALYFIAWIFENRFFTEWVCVRCRKIAGTATVNENED